MQGNQGSPRSGFQEKAQPLLTADERIKMHEDVATKDKNKVIGPNYNLRSTLNNGRSIPTFIVPMLIPQHLQPGDRILFAGVGHGKDAIHAAELGAQVTVFDLS